MAIRSSENQGEEMTNSFATAPSATAGATTAAPSASASAGPASGANLFTSLRDLTGFMTGTSGLTTDGRKYLETMQEIFKQNAANNGTPPIETTILPEPSGVVVLSCENQIMFLIFQESVSGLKSSIPPTVVLQDAKASYWRMKNITVNAPTIFPPLTITKYDYPCVDKMAAWIYANFHVATLGSSITADVLTTELIQITPIMSDVESFVQEFSPHGIPARADFGFKFSIVPKNQGYQDRSNFFSSYKSGVYDIAAVTAYVELVTADRTPQGIQRYTPIVHISDVITRIPSLRVYLMLIAWSAEMFIRYGLWKNQFVCFNKDKPNIGNLMVEADGNLSFVDNQAKLDNFIYNYLTQPILAVDVVDGRARVLGTEMFALPENEFQIRLRDEFMALFPNKELKVPMHVPCMTFGYNEFVGGVAHSGRILDTRWVSDYLQLAVHFKRDLNRIQRFLFHAPGDATTRFELLQQFYNEARAYYASSVSMVNLDFIGAIQEVLRSFTQLSQNSFTPSGGAIDFTGLAKQTGDYMARNAGMAPTSTTIYGHTSIQPGIYHTPSGR